jgi:hypothetical protein
MSEEFRIDEGHIFSLEEYIFNVRWKVADLINQGYSKDVIILWEDNEIWYLYAKYFLRTYYNKQ